MGYTNYMGIYASSGEVENALGYRQLNKPYVALVNDEIDWNTQEANPSKVPFHFNILSDGDIIWKADGTMPRYYIWYSINGGNWTRIMSQTTGVTIPVKDGDLVVFSGSNQAYSYAYNSSSYFNSTCKFKVGGNIMSLLYGSDFATATTFTKNNVFSNLFKGCTGLTDASDLVLPATAMTDYCYYNMFSGCTGLTTAPSSIGTSATTLANNCYAGMFNNCRSLTTAPELPATTLATSCYIEMFAYCTGLTTAPSILPATTLAEKCYFSMFLNCSKITTAPELPATTLAKECYYQMFNYCKKLNYIKCLATDISANQCTTNWVPGVANSGTFVKDANMSSWTTGYNGIPSGWTVQDA